MRVGWIVPTPLHHALTTYTEAIHTQEHILKRGAYPVRLPFLRPGVDIIVSRNTSPDASPDL